MVGSGESDQSNVPATFPELVRFISELIDDVEKAKNSSVDQVNHLVLERDEAQRDLSSLRTQHEIDLQEKDELRLKVSVLTDELEVLKPELEEARSELEEARSMLLKVQELQEELEHYFLLSRDQSRLLEASAKLQSRSTALMLKVVN